MKALFCYKVFGLAVDTETGEPGYGYVQTALRDDNDNPVDIPDDLYNEAHLGHRGFIAKTLKRPIEEIIMISQQEHDENVSDEE